MEFYKLLEKHPYVYEIQNQYYCIGKAVFRKCTVEEIELYQSINSGTEILREMPKEHFAKFWKKNVCDNFNKLLDLCSNDYSDSEMKRCKCEYEKLLSGCKAEEVEKINSQITRFVELLELKWETEADNLAKKGRKI